MKQTNPNQAPYVLTAGFTADQANGLFKILFKDKANRQVTVLENATKEQILKISANKEIIINIKNGIAYLCMNIDGIVYQLQMSSMS